MSTASRPAPPPSRSSPPPQQARAAPPAPVAAPPSAVGAPAASQGPGLVCRIVEFHFPIWILIFLSFQMGQMMATAGGVAIGSAVVSVIGIR